MEEFTRCNLFIIGDNAVGKTTLIESIRISDRLRRSQIRRESSHDWVIDDVDVQLLVTLKELTIPIAQTLYGIRRTRSAVMLVVRVSANNEISSDQKANIKRLRPIAADCLLMIAFNFVNEQGPDNFDINAIKQKYPFFRYFFVIPELKNGAYNPLLELRLMVRRIMINNFTDKLITVRKAIHKNLLSKSKLLDLGNCGLTSLQEIKELFNNTHLEILVLSNEWGEYLQGKWVRQESANHGPANILYDIPGGINLLTNLKVLICGGNWNSRTDGQIHSPGWHITDISVIKDLHNLTVLNASNNDIEDVGQVDKLISLKSLYLNNNKISRLPSLDNMTRLREIYLSNNRITDVGFLKGLKNVSAIDLHSNLVRDLSPLRELIARLDIINSKWESSSISILNNPLDIPAPSVVFKGKNAVLAFFRQLEAEQNIKLAPFRNKDIKLILVGNSNVGKSTLANWLLHEKVDRNIGTTHWMKVERWRAAGGNGGFNVRIFDFGGQEYYHDTHHLFFTNRTAYIVLWDEHSNRFGEVETEQRQMDNSIVPIKIQTFPLKYWLDAICFHTKRRNKTKSEKEIEKLLITREGLIRELSNPSEISSNQTRNPSDKSDTVKHAEENILIVQNKVDNQQDKRFLNEHLLKSEHEKIYDFSSISIFNERGLHSLKNKLFEVFRSLDIINQENLGTWGHIKERIEKESFVRPYTLSGFRDFCNEIIKHLPEVADKKPQQIREVLFSDQDAEVFAEYLADIGVVLYYPDNNNLKDKIFLNQNKILQHIHQILLGLCADHGEFNKHKIQTVLGKDTSDQEVADIIDLMLHFKIIFPHPGKPDTYIAPLYLPKEPVQSIKIFSGLFSKPVYRYKYKSFIHKNVILDFFHHYGKKALRQSNNRNDLYYYWREGIVVKDENTGEIVMVTFFPGDSNDQKAFIDVFSLRESAEETFLKRIIEDLDIINEGWDVEKMVPAGDGEFVPLSLILKNETEDNWAFVYDKKYYKLADFKKYLLKPIKMKKIFISYSKQDLALVNKFIDHLSALQLDGKVSHWYCTELMAGSEWDHDIQKHFDEADIACFMISPNFMRTKYIHEYEIAKAFDKKAKHPSFKIVPIILDFCKWSTTKNNLARFTALPYTAKPVMDFESQNMAWYLIQESLRLMIDNDLHPEGDNFYSQQHLPQDVRNLYTRIVGGI